MVDFNNEATIGTPAANVVKILILQARANVLEALEKYNQQASSGIESSSGFLVARLGSWFLEHQAYLKRTLNKKDYEELIKNWQGKILLNTDAPSQEEILEMILHLNEICDKLRLTRIDLKANYDRTLIEEDNKHNDLR